MGVHVHYCATMGVHVHSCAAMGVYVHSCATMGLQKELWHPLGKVVAAASPSSSFHACARTCPHSAHTWM